MYGYQHCIELDAKTNPQKTCETTMRSNFWLMNEDDRGRVCSAISADVNSGEGADDTCGYIVVSAHQTYYHMY